MTALEQAIKSLIEIEVAAAEERILKRLSERISKSLATSDSEETSLHKSQIQSINIEDVSYSKNLFSMNNSPTKNFEALPDILTAKHISNYLGISRRRVYELMQLSSELGGITCFEIGSSKRIEKRNFALWLESRNKKSMWP